MPGSHYCARRNYCQPTRSGDADPRPLLTGIAFCATLRGMSESHLSPGEIVYRELGMTAVAKECGVAESTVWRWAQPQDKGTGGLVPAKYHRKLLHLAHRLGKQLNADDLVLGRHV